MFTNDVMPMVTAQSVRRARYGKGGKLGPAKRRAARRERRDVKAWFAGLRHTVDHDEAHVPVTYARLTAWDVS